MPINTETKKSTSYLYQHEAQMRSSIIKDIHYTIDLEFRDNTNQYNGSVMIKFNVVRESQESLFIEFAGRHLNKLVLDGDVVENIEEIWKYNRIQLPQEWSKNPREHNIQTDFESVYDNTGYGLFVFRENETFDEKTYIYSCFASNYAHTVFPCFDQPDMKATFRLNVMCPLEWVVVSNQNEESRVDELWCFPKTPPISTYLFCINAGHWHRVSPPIENNYKHIQTNFYCRRKLSHRLAQNQQAILDLLNFGIEYYERTFEFPYPFQKYDQVFCPEFNYSGMENPGAVLITENFLFLDQVSPARLSSRALTILHEISHMWFGDLVTMKWWKDIWLNESFAVFISYHCTEEYGHRVCFDDLWCKLFSYKEYGYEQDTQTQTHAIEINVDEASESQDNFDSITYSKGAAVLHQFVSLIGFNTFIKAIRKYLVKYQWLNADMENLFEVIHEVLLEDNKSFSLQQWIKDWICTPSLNILQVSINNNQIVINQTPFAPQYNVLRFHSTPLTTYYDNGENETHNIQINSIQSITFESQRKPLAAILNRDDSGYFLQVLDRNILEYFCQNFNIFTEDLERKNFIKSLFQSSIYYDLPVKLLLEWLFSLLLRFTSEEVITYILQTFSSIFEFIPLQFKIEWNCLIFESLYGKLMQFIEEDSQDKHLMVAIREQISNFAHTEEHFKILYDWLTQNNQRLHKALPAESQVVRGYFMNYLMKKEQVMGQVKELLEKYWSRYKTSSTYFRRIQQGCDMPIEQIAKQMEDWISEEKPIEFSLFELEYLMMGFANEFSSKFNEFEKLYFNQFWKLAQIKNKQLFKRILNKLHPKQGNYQLQLDIMTAVIKQVEESDLADRKFKITMIQQKIDHLILRIKLKNSMN